MSDQVDAATVLIERAEALRPRTKLGTHHCVVFASCMDENEPPLEFDASNPLARSEIMSSVGIDFVAHRWVLGYVDPTTRRIQWLGNDPNLRGRIQDRLEELRQHR